MTGPTPRLSRAQFLAAEIFGYSYANYQDHLGIGNTRYERLMPERRREPDVEHSEGYFDGDDA